MFTVVCFSLVAGWQPLSRALYLQRRGALLTLQDWSNIAQIVTTIVTSIGIVGTILFSVRSLREITKERHIQVRPLLSFERGGWQIPIKFANRGVAIPGYNPGYLKTVISLPENAESIVLELEDRGYGILRNHGLGPALECEVCWIAEEVVIAGSKFKVTEDKLKEPLYCEELNTWPALTRNIHSGESAEINCIPSFIVKDHRKQIERVDGLLKIKCKDLYDNDHVFLQEFHFFTHYENDEPMVHVTFSDPKK